LGDENMSTAPRCALFLTLKGYNGKKTNAGSRKERISLDCKM
jgi:hypothetical protein